MAKERLTITQGLCDHIRILLNGGADMQRAAELTGISQATVSRIKAAGFDAGKYAENNERRRADEQNKKKPRAEELTDEEYNNLINKIKHSEFDQVPGQLTMDLPKQESEKDKAAMMRFLAGKNDENKRLIISYMDALAVKLTTINDTMCQILRAVSGK